MAWKPLTQRGTSHKWANWRNTMYGILWYEEQCAQSENPWLKRTEISSTFSSSISIVLHWLGNVTNNQSNESGITYGTRCYKMDRTIDVLRSKTFPWPRHTLIVAWFPPLYTEDRETGAALYSGTYFPFFSMSRSDVLSWFMRLPSFRLCFFPLCAKINIDLSGLDKTRSRRMRMCHHFGRTKKKKSAKPCARSCPQIIPARIAASTYMAQ